MALRLHANGYDLRVASQNLAPGLNVVQVGVHASNGCAATLPMGLAVPKAAAATRHVGRVHVETCVTAWLSWHSQLWALLAHVKCAALYL
jgi:hypothetical protein